MTSSSTPPRRRNRRKDARPSEIIEAALEVFTDKGFAAARLDEVAALAGISKGTLYLYFPSKEELFKAMVRQTVIPNFGQFEAVIAAHPGPVADLLTQLLTRAALIFGTTKIGRIPKIIIAESSTFPDLARFWVAEVVEKGVSLLRRVVTMGVEAGEFAPVKAEAVVTLFAPVLMLALWNNAIGPAVGRMLDPALIGTEASRILLDGLKTRDGKP